ncbi:Rexo1 protein [Coprinopsis sp. MPI-PUGE-AT-0042]|nr:Rexo1 protein [Coprinopsis sp. MPI-PUGE-AT-0042]
MFPSQAKFQAILCPERDSCNRVFCPFSHKPGQSSAQTLDIPVQQPVASSSQQPKQPNPLSSKRAAPSSPVVSKSGSPAPKEPPRKLQKATFKEKTFPVATSSTYTDNGEPVLRTSAALSRVPIPVRQTMLKTLYTTFKTLYEPILPSCPTLPADHALMQEEEIYAKTNKQTYRVAAIQCIGAVKRRETPTSVSHILELTRQLLEPLVHSVEELKTWGYIVEVPEGEGSREPSLEGQVTKCERCAKPFQVKRMENADKCHYHWGKPLSTRSNGEKTRIYTCCSKPVAESDWCTEGTHVFYENVPTDLHARHAFSFLKPPDPATKTLEVAALDCEMIYTTGGMRVARISIVDGAGKEVFDEFIRMDEGVEVIDYNTRFSGVTPENYAKAALSLSAARETLDSMINTGTILLGHALDNDLKTMRIVHHRCVDTALLFPHRAGPPYRLALKNLVREKLGKTIQAGTADVSVGHSSVEDASATLDLVKWYILNTPQRKPATA